MIVYFAIYSFLGYIMESCYISLLKRQWFSSGLLKGPYIPLYGIGSLILILCMPYFYHPFVCFFIGGIFMTTLEFVSSLYIEKVFHKQCWDYSNHFLHYHGRICLLYFCIWCFLSYTFITYIHPLITLWIPYNDFTILLSLIFEMMMIKSLIEELNQSPHRKLFHKKTII